MKMKLHSKLLISLLFLTGVATVALAGPGPDYWTRMSHQTPKTSAPQVTPPAQPATKADLPGELTCAHMLVPNAGGFSKIPFTSVRCTPEMLKKDWRCQQACAMAQKH